VVVIAAPPADTATSGATVSVVLDEWKLLPARAAVRAGRVTFVARNDGSMTHEFVVLRSDRRAGGLPVKGGKAVETGTRGELSQIASGVSRRLTLTLRPGRYVLLCNLLGHYQAGQFAALRVR
jgi:uncharacterized cupredoxin-like copper-binding protein